MVLNALLDALMPMLCTDFSHCAYLIDPLEYQIKSVEESARHPMRFPGVILDLRGLHALWRGISWHNMNM